MLERDFDLVIINAPLRMNLEIWQDRLLERITQVILVVANEYFDAVSAVCENDGVLTVAKPINKAILWSALKLARAASLRLKRMQAENSTLKQKIEDIRRINRAKCLLISYLNMSEQEAHRYIENRQWICV